ncbi:MAG: adenine phosphoribosyltransferase [Candidatus Sericytochromatia bacterium]|nr:adenine phosphoribosyltransferase [Candidatus Sericytochromatia bacterium]MEB3221369.1 adenine phosphoribosyltransferase [Candidatus Sericytochromatia bacterium]
MTTTPMLDLDAYVRDIPDFPKPGIVFKDISPLLRDAAAFSAAIDRLVAHHRTLAVDYVVGIESRGFLVGAPLANHLGKGFIPVRKPGKLPARTEAIAYALEYGSGTLEIHADALAAGHRVLIVDDLLATGGTVAATRALVERLGGHVVGVSFLIELAFLGGRERLPGLDVHALLTY